MNKTGYIAAAVVLAASLAFSGPALAGKGNRGGGTNTTITLTPSPGSVGQVVWVSGCGFNFAPVVLQVVDPSGKVQNYNVAMWANGCMDKAGFMPTESGQYTVNILQDPNGKALNLVATTQESVS
jgi:hypothetical protein